ncbi:MAG: hypothetical protein WCV58_01960 [Patescibacteria group bacterium]|jgi:hypothetical protein
MIIHKIYIGGWFQRTTLHLTEVWDFLKSGKTDLSFDAEEFKLARERLDVKDISRQNNFLEYVFVNTNDKIDYRIYEDGLIVLEKEFEDLEKDFKAIKDYYDSKLSKSLSYLFSKGAPVPKELANIKTILPYIVMVSDATKQEAQELFNDHNEEVYSMLSTGKIEVYRSPGIILINNLESDKLAREIIEAEIFFREYKTQLHRYLSIHRTIWEKIERIKELDEIKGSEIEKYRNELSIYQKTITLIDARIEQMDTYIQTRQKIVNLQQIDEKLKPLFDFKYETLQDTHEYIKDLWLMTKDYLDSAIQMLEELQSQSTVSAISSLRLITSIGVVAGVVGYLEVKKIPKFTLEGIFYFIILLVAAIAVNQLITKFYLTKKYRIDDQEIDKNIK